MSINIPFVSCVYSCGQRGIYCKMEEKLGIALSHLRVMRSSTKIVYRFPKVGIFQVSRKFSTFQFPANFNQLEFTLNLASLIFQGTKFGTQVKLPVHLKFCSICSLFSNIIIIKKEFLWKAGQCEMPKI